MLYKILLCLMLVCLFVTCFYTLTGRVTDDGQPLTFTSNTFLYIIEESPRIPTDWILSLENIKVNFNIEKSIVNFFKDLFTGKFSEIFTGSNEDAYPQGGIGGGGGGARGDSSATGSGLGLIATIWNLNVDSMAFVCFLGTYGIQILTYAGYFLKYVFI